MPMRGSQLTTGNAFNRPRSATRSSAYGRARRLLWIAPAALLLGAIAIGSAGAAGPSPDPAPSKPSPPPAPTYTPPPAPSYTPPAQVTPPPRATTPSHARTPARHKPKPKPKPVKIPGPLINQPKPGAVLIEPKPSPPAPALAQPAAPTPASAPARAGGGSIALRPIVAGALNVLMGLLVLASGALLVLAAVDPYYLRPWSLRRTIENHRGDAVAGGLLLLVGLGIVYLISRSSGL